MERTRVDLRRLGWLVCLAAVASVGCQTVKTPEEQIAKTNLPRELSKVSMPTYVVEPPDYLMVEVLEALPGRPISGERLVRPDGTITLGYYGDVYVAGLTLPEVKEKIILHLRKFLSDEVLGLVVPDPDDPKGEKFVEKAPAESDRVYVDVTLYNSKYYYIQGDVGLPGRYPITGNETVLDALNFAGGLLPTASQPNIRLVRPAPPGACCEQLLPINYAAIIYGGDPTTNYQLMPGDRIVVFRDPIVRTTIFIERLAAPFNTVVNSILTYGFTASILRSLNTPIGGVAGGAANTAAQGRPLVAPGAR